MYASYFNSIKIIISLSSMLTKMLNKSFYLFWKKGRKVVYMGHRRFLPLNQALRKRGNHFKGKAEHQIKPDNRSGEDVFNMVNDVQVVFGKGPGSQPIPNNANEHAPMWKKSIL